VTVTGRTIEELRSRRDAVGEADLVELRLDALDQPHAAGALAGRRRPVIVTCRAAWEGGAFRGSEDERRTILAEALACGADYVDVEWQASFRDALLGSARDRVVVSYHDFERTPSDVEERLRAMRASGATVTKLAVQTNRLSDCLRLQELGRTFGADGRLALIGMGERGLASRALPSRFHSKWTYAGDIAAVGQVSASLLVDTYGFRRTTASTSVYGLTGSPLGHSLSPAMHNAAFRAAAQDAVYLPLPAADVDDFVTFARGFGLNGASVTIPFKVDLLAHVDEPCMMTRRVGAVNTVRVDNGRWLGRNTDVPGFLAPLRARNVALTGARAAVIGAGGSARAVTAALASAGATVTVHARRANQAADVASVGPAAVGAWPLAPGGWDLLVNCTPVGLSPHVDASPVPVGSLTGRLVYDLIYNPPTTRLMREAAAAGCATIGGLDMLVAQAEEQFAWWTGVRPEPGIMRAAAETRLAELESHENHLV
jgi:3-dehydroquinate dehydratase/shikimate dehydrogenase